MRIDDLIKVTLSIMHKCLKDFKNVHTNYNNILEQLFKYLNLSYG